MSVALLALPDMGFAQTGSAPGYFMPPAANSAVIAVQPASQTTPVIDSHLTDDLNHSPVIQAQPIGNANPVIDSHLGNEVWEPPLEPVNPPLPWYETDWGVAGIGVVATGATFALDHGINQYANTKISPGIRKTALHGADILELAPLAFSLATMVQSPVSDPELAHASSIAVTSAAEVTAEAFVLKYAIGRQRPGEEDGSPFSFYPFNASKSTFSLGAVFPGEGAQTSSFPSGHTMLAFALITPYAEEYHEPLLYMIPAAVGVGRIMSPDGHWASDVVAGGFLGWLTADLTRRYFPNSDYGLMIFGDGQQMMVGINGRF